MYTCAWLVPPPMSSSTLGSARLRAAAAATHRGPTPDATPHRSRAWEAAEETVRPRVLPTGDSSAGLPCVGLGRNNVYFQRGLNRNLTKASRNNFKQISQNSFEKKWVQVDGMQTIKGQIGILRENDNFLTDEC